MGEPLTLALALRADRNPDERGAANFIFAIFIAVALAFLFSTLVPLMTPTNSIDIREVFSALHSSDKEVVALQNGVMTLDPQGPTKLRTALVTIEKQTLGQVIGRFCAGVYKVVDAALVPTTTSFKDALQRTCNDPLTSVQQRTLSQAVAFGPTSIKQNPFIVVIYDRNDPNNFIAQPALAISTNAAVNVTSVEPQVVSPGGAAIATATPVPAATNTPPPPPPTNTPVATPTPVVEPTNTPSLGSTGGNLDTNPSVSETNQNQPANSGRAVDAYSF